MRQMLDDPGRRWMALTVLALAAAGLAGIVLGPSGLLAALLPLALVCYSAMLADRGAARGPGPALARANDELRAANERLGVRLLAATGESVRDADADRHDGALVTVELLRTFLDNQRAEPAAVVDERDAIVVA